LSNHLSGSTASSIDAAASPTQSSVSCFCSMLGVWRCVVCPTQQSCVDPVQVVRTLMKVSIRYLLFFAAEAKPAKQWFVFEGGNNCKVREADIRTICSE
ncbi:MAG: hypothetical protein AAGH38_07655, partial [Pseudomonadota bacterium]